MAIYNVDTDLQVSHESPSWIGVFAPLNAGVAEYKAAYSVLH